MFEEHQLVSIFCEIDDFCKELDKNISQPLLSAPTKGRRGPACCLSVSEIMTIQILFQMVGYRNFKTFYTCFLQTYWKHYFPNLPSYSRFVELISLALLPLMLFTQFKSGKKQGFIISMEVACLFAILRGQNAIKCLKKLLSMAVPLWVGFLD